MTQNPSGEVRSERPRRSTLELRPFRGLRFDPRQAGPLGSVVSPPYDVLDPDIVRDLESANRHNVVRLILARRYEAPYRAVAQRLQDWRARGVLSPDPEPALYVHEYTSGGATVRGVVGLVALREEDERVILPHEDVMRGPVEDRVVLMRTTRTNLEPILLVHEGTGTTRRLLEEATAAAPLEAFEARDGSVHRLWAIREREQLQVLAAELAPGRALIADGHHRYAAYLRLRSMHAARSEEGDPWAYGLAMLVDQMSFPLSISPIHRTVEALTLADVEELCAQLGHRFMSFRGRKQTLEERDVLASDPSRVAVVVSDGSEWALVDAARTAPVDAAVLTHSIFPRWRVSERQVGYHHSVEQALRRIERRPGVLVLLRPPSAAEVMAAAERGVRLPRKSTSFGPKPLVGLVMRDLRDG